MRRLTLLLVLACALAAPHHHKKHAHARKRSSDVQLKMELREVAERAVCPIRQEIDDDPLRVPRRIKMLKCARAPNPVCARPDVRARQACCGHAHDSFSTQCVEVQDTVLVSYSQPDGSSRLDHAVVSVGCTCMIRESRAGLDDA